MNSVLQQLFMIKAIRNFILSVDTSNVEFASKQNINATQSTAAVTSSSSIFDDLDDTTTENHNNLELSSRSVNNNVVMSEDDQRKEYNMSIFRHLQMIYGHLAESKMQYYVPKGFWRQFRFGNERVNLREQHDAVEFFNSVVDCIDESMKSISKEQICSKILGGTFADQKICKGCPHRYSREESFTLLSVDVKHSQRLSESLEQYVKGDLLEGPNAYHCEKCNKKIDAVKRTCIKKLPLVLAIQLKRFDYDWEREIAVKSNEYFEFPRELDMDPYTVKGVARIERQQELIKKRQQEIAASQTSGQNNPQIQIFNTNSKIDDMDLYEDEEENDENSAQFSNKYRLVGIVVHSGQANGGHYYSFIQTKSNNDGLEEESSPSGKDDENNSTSTNSSYNNWYKFDDGEVSEFKMDDEEMRNQCYGGDYTGEVYDNIMKRMAYKKQKRWWNAYILFYERIKLNENSNKSINENITDSMEIKSGSLVHQNQLLYNYQSVKMPSFILRSVHKKNIKFSHHRHHFSVEYFQFIKKLTQANLCLCQNDTPLVTILKYPYA
jgi:ubiquitin carboxyl-terminal hydrolase 9/24